MSEEEACNTATCPDLCNGQERYYNVNSGVTGTIYIASYSAANVVYRNNHPEPLALLASGEVWSGAIPDLANGDFICASSGPINVYTDGFRQSDWVPGRFAGTKFIFAKPRYSPQGLYVRALDADATVKLVRGGTTIATRVVSANAIDVIRFAFDGAATLLLTSDQKIVASYAAEVATAGGPKNQEGIRDYYPIPFGGNNVRGFLLWFASCPFSLSLLHFGMFLILLHVLQSLGFLCQS